MTDQEKLDMYLKLSKKELAKMLIEANKHLENQQPTYIPYPYNPNPYPVIGSSSGTISTNTID